MTCYAKNLTLSALLHIFILFSVLSSLFILIISKLEARAFNDEIQSVAQDKLLPALKKHSTPATDAILRRLNYDKLEAYYNQTSNEITVNNNWLKGAMIAGNVILFLVIISLTFAWRGCLNFKHVFIENVVVFALVGVFEFLFFKNVASKYVPVAPSTIQRVVYDNLWTSAH